jgi:hypothetical protein
VPFCYVGRLLGCRVVYVECLSRVWRYRVSAGSLYGAGADLATVLANRRAMRRALRRDPRTRVLAVIGAGPLAAAHVASAWWKVAPRRRGHARLLSPSGAARHAGHGAGQDGQVAA